MRIVLPLIHLDQIVFTPLPQLRLKNALVAAGHDPDDVTILEYSRDDSLQAMLHEIISLRPNVVGFSCYTWNFLAVERLSEALSTRLPAAHIVWGGPHVSEAPSRFLQRYAGSVDNVVTWYGEGSFVELVGAYMLGATPLEAAHTIPGVFALDPVIDFYVVGKRATDYTHIESLGYPYQHMPASVTDRIAERVFLIESYRNCPFSCFPAGVHVSTTEGSNRRIEDVKVGDVLLGFDEATKTLTETTVVETFKHEATELVRIYFDAQIKGKTVTSIVCTPEHPFYVNGRWVTARELAPGDEIYHATGTDKKSLLMRLHNPVAREDVRERIRATVKLQSSALVARMRQTRASGRWRPGVMTSEGRESISSRMRLNNPMYRPEVARKASNSLKASIASGQVVPTMLQPGWADRFKSINKEEQALLDLLNAFFPDAWAFTGTSDKSVGWCKPDFMHTDEKKIIEYHGCYWHNCPTCYPTPSFTVNVGRDHAKRKEYESQGYKLLEVWSHELRDVDALTQKIGAFTYNGVKVVKVVPFPEKSTTFLRKKYGTYSPTTTVYNLHCEPHNNYFANDLLSHNCSYCLWGQAEKSYEALSADTMVEQMYSMVCDGARIFMYADAGLGLIREDGKQRDLEVFRRFASDGVLQRNKVELRGYFFWQTMTDETLDVIKELIDQKVMGQLDIGIQTFNPAVLPDLQRPTNYDKFFATVERLHQRDIRFSLDLILGLPGDNFDGFRESLRKVISCRPDRTQSFPLSILPGTAYDLRRDELGIETIRGSYRDDAETVIATNTFSYADMQRALDLEAWMFLYYAEGLFAEGLNAIALRTGRDELDLLQSLKAFDAPALHSLVEIYRGMLYDSRSDGRHALEQRLMETFSQVYQEILEWALSERAIYPELRLFRDTLLAFPKTWEAAAALDGVDGILFVDKVTPLLTRFQDGTFAKWEWQRDPVIGAIVRNRNFYLWTKTQGAA